MRTPTQTRRFKKLISFLNKLDPKQFDFQVEVTSYDEKGCGAVCCAIGWTPKVFPGLVRWSSNWNSNNGPLVLIKDESVDSYRKIAQELFGVPWEHDIFYPNKAPWVNDKLPKCGYDATPQAVAAMLKRYMELYP